MRERRGTWQLDRYNSTIIQIARDNRNLLDTLWGFFEKGIVLGATFTLLFEWCVCGETRIVKDEVGFLGGSADSRQGSLKIDQRGDAEI